VLDQSRLRRACQHGFAKEGARSPLSVHVVQRMRARVFNPAPGMFFEGDTRASGQGACEVSSN
jgi:hypothetical protein